MQLRIQNTTWRFNITPFRLALMALVALMAVFVFYRLIVGLGPTTNMTDNWPWGLWKLPALGWVAITAGGFTTALMVYVLNIEEYKPLVRGTMVVSLLGYILSLVSLGLDIGLWYQFWTPYFFWGSSSILFDVYWCISLYATVQIIKFCEPISEKVLPTYKKYFLRIAPVLVVAGILLPTLHQTALGSLYLLMVGKLYPLWWSNYIGVFFLLTAFFLGPAMVIVENYFRSKIYNRPFRADLLYRLARISAYIMIFYLCFKFVDLARLGALGYIFDSALETFFFFLEYGVCVALPIVIMFTQWGKTKAGLVTFGILVSFGVFLTRVNVIMIGMMDHYGFYFPSLIEWIVFAGMVSLWILLYMLIVENLNIIDYPKEAKSRELSSLPKLTESFEPAGIAKKTV